MNAGLPAAVAVPGCAPFFAGVELIESVADPAALAVRMQRAYSAGLDGVETPLRTSIQRAVPFRAFDTMPAYSEAERLFVTKIGAVIPRQHPGQKSVHALVVAFSGDSGQPLGIFDGEAVSSLKCAAVAAMVTALCTADQADTMGLIGSGVQALSQLRAVAAVRALRHVKVYARNEQRLAGFVRHCQGLFPSLSITACGSAQDAVAGVDIVSTATTATVPLVESGWLRRPGLHINCFGNHTAESREIPHSVLASGSIVIVEDMETALEEAGRVHAAAVPLHRLHELEPAALKRERTVFSSTGHAYLDLLAVDYLLERLNIQRCMQPTMGQ